MREIEGNCEGNCKEVKKICLDKSMNRYDQKTGGTHFFSAQYWLFALFCRDEKRFEDRRSAS